MLNNLDIIDGTASFIVYALWTWTGRAVIQQRDRQMIEALYQWNKAKEAGATEVTVELEIPDWYVKCWVILRRTRNIPLWMLATSGVLDGYVARGWLDLAFGALIHSYFIFRWAGVRNKLFPRDNDGNDGPRGGGHFKQRVKQVVTRVRSRLTVVPVPTVN